MKKTGKDALLAWCKNKTQGYAGVDVSNFSASWRDGLALCALVHSLRPNLIPWESLNRSNEIENLNLAFNAAEKFGVPKLLDAEDMSPGPPEPFSVTTYLGTFYHAASKLETATPASTAPPARPAEPERPKTTAAVLPASTVSNRPSATNALAPPKSPASESQNALTQLNGTTCYKCTKTASGMMVDWGGNLFHQECFKCYGCNRAFRKNCLNIDGSPYCETCGRKAFVQSRLLKHGLASASDTPPRSPSGSTSSNATSLAPSTSSNATSLAPSTQTRSPASSVHSSSTTGPSTAPTASSASRSPATSISTSSTTGRSPAGSASTSPGFTSSNASSAANSTSSPAASQSLGSTSTPTISVTSSNTSSISKPATSTSRVTGGSVSQSRGSTASNTSAQYSTSDSVVQAKASSASASNSASNSNSASKLSTPTLSTTGRKESTAVAYSPSSSTTSVARSPSGGSVNSQDPNRSPAGSTATAAPKTESIMERELREQREKEEELAAARARAKSSTEGPVAPKSTSPTPQVASTPSNTPSLKPTTSARSLGKSKTVNLGSTTSAASTSFGTTQTGPYKASTVKDAPKGESIIEREMREQREREEALQKDRQSAVEVAKGISSPSLASSSSPAVTSSSPIVNNPPTPSKVESAGTTTPATDKTDKTSTTLSRTATASTSTSASSTYSSRGASNSVAKPIASVAKEVPSQANRPSSPSNVVTPATTVISSADKAEEERRRVEEAERAFLSSNKPQTSSPVVSQLPVQTNATSTSAPQRPVGPPPADLVITSQNAPGGASNPKLVESRPRLVSAMPALYTPKPTMDAKSDPLVTTTTVPDPSGSPESTMPVLPPRATTMLPEMPPLPSRVGTVAPGQLQIEDIAAPSSASSSNAVEPADEFAEQFEPLENEDPEISEKMRRATTQLRRVNVSKVAEGHQGWLKRRDRTAAIKLFWTPLWFSVKDSRLLYYKDAQSHNTLASEHPPEGFLSLQYIETIRLSSSNDRKFIIEGPAAKWDLKASTKEAALAWVEAMNDAVTIYNLTEKDAKRISSRPVFGQDHAEDALMQGHLDRQTALGFSRNWWLLQDGMLFYFASQGGKRLGRIPLYHCEFAPYEMTGSTKDAIRAFCITTHTGEKVILAAKDEMEMHRWLNCMLRQRIIIEEAIDMISF